MKKNVEFRNLHCFFSFFDNKNKKGAGLADAKEYKPKPIEAVAADAELAKVIFFFLNFSKILKFFCFFVSKKTVQKSEKVEVITTKNGGKLSTSKVNFNKSFRCRYAKRIAKKKKKIHTFSK